MGKKFDLIMNNLWEIEEILTDIERKLEEKMKDKK